MPEPATIEEIQEAVRGSESLVPVGGNTKPALTSLPDHCSRVSMKRLSGVIEYDPSEFTITVLAGTPLSEIQSILREQGQYLPFDPPLASAGATIGGTVAAGLNGPGAHRFGTIRDFLIGLRYVNCEARIITGGGKVVKNAAGFDIPKFLVGSLGRLGILIELTFKVFPEPEARSTFSIETKDSQQAAELIAQLSRAAFDLDALDYSANTNIVRGRLSGNPEAIEKRLPVIAETIDQNGSFTVLSPGDATAFWTRQLDFGWCDQDLALAKFATTVSLIAEQQKKLGGTDDTTHYSIGGNVAWMNAPLDLLENEKVMETPGLLIRNPGSQYSPIWTGSPRKEFEIQAALKRAFDEPGKFPPF